MFTSIASVCVRMHLMNCQISFTANKYSFTRGTAKFQNLYLGKIVRAMSPSLPPSTWPLLLHCCTVTSVIKIILTLKSSGLHTVYDHTWLDSGYTAGLLICLLAAVAMVNSQVAGGACASRSCAGCGGRIADRFLLFSMERYWHTRCLKCSCCQAQLGEIGTTCYSKGGMILCRTDYIRSDTSSNIKEPQTLAWLWKVLQ